MKKIRFTNCYMAAIGLCIFLTLLGLGAYKSYAEDSLKTADWCSFLIPSQFEPSTEKGVFKNKSYPMESSSIMYSIYDNGKEVKLTNREKEALKGSVAPSVADETEKITKEIYEETLSAAYNSEYGQDVGFSVSAFENITVDGYPGYRIDSSYQAQDEEVIYQTVYMLLSRYRTFTITFQRAEDDDCEDLFKECASSIHVH